VVLLLSNSGETTELADVIAYTRRFNIPMVAVASRAGSTLMSQADVAVLLPDFPEACTVGMAPTTSTTLAMALGDALAVALMECRQFTPDNYRDFHPGGNLGAKLARVKDLMHKGHAMPLVGATAPMPEVLLTITQKGFGVAGVLDDSDRLVGIITDGDLRRHMNGLLDLLAHQVMTANPRTITPSTLASHALGEMNDRRITTLFAVDPDGNGAPEGILHIHDCLRAGIQ
jgi:arabinose-5-phosphate isomerase